MVLWVCSSIPVVWDKLALPPLFDVPTVTTDSSDPMKHFIAPVKMSPLFWTPNEELYLHRLFQWPTKDDENGIKTSLLHLVHAIIQYVFTKTKLLQD